MALFCTGVLLTKNEGERIRYDERRQGKEALPGHQPAFTGAVMSMRKHRPTRTEQDDKRRTREAEALTLDAAEIFSKKPDLRLKWLQKALMLVGRGTVQATPVYDIVSHTKFLHLAPDAIAKQLARTLLGNLHLFSPKQQRFLQSESNKFRAAAALKVAEERPPDRGGTKAKRPRSRSCTASSRSSSYSSSSISTSSELSSSIATTRYCSSPTRTAARAAASAGAGATSASGAGDRSQRHRAGGSSRGPGEHPSGHGGGGSGQARESKKGGGSAGKSAGVHGTADGTAVADSSSAAARSGRRHGRSRSRSGGRGGGGGGRA
eukprot:NODE_8157_length_1518_cov_5.800144.p2 GENE.NODE_8157_length_1518_cov_5.800144~~NODE_8157_length_1518_cov_5.800144.p2  ORF type:complete len:321 (+),score=76.82 NODE_8157_length_1518_cov_5.800144:225-1187(+)